MQSDGWMRLGRGLRELGRGRLGPLPTEALVCALVFAFSISIALGWAKAREAQGPAPAARVAVWASDRDGNRVFGLDRDLLVVNSIAMRSPIEVEARSDGGAWVVSSIGADPLGRHQLVRLSFDGAQAARAPLGPILDLACDDFGRAIVVDLDASGPRVSLFDASALAVWLRPWTQALCATAAGQRCLVGTSAGELALFDLNAPQAAPLRANWGGVISDVAPGPSPGSWWALDSAASGRLALLDSSLAVIWSRGIGLHAIHLAPIAGTERIWVADTTEPHVRRFGPGGVLEVDRPDMPLGGLDRGSSAAHGTVIFAAPGALLRLDGLGQTMPGQAGFDFLVDVSAVSG